ncbi:MAG: adenine phosphoribosyltransferase [Clostridia bacterium]|nr:adenine phosphoribosyltransferase [Clostridia bacterium]
MFYTMTIAGLERNLPICPLNENLQIAGFVIFGDPELTTACAKELLAKAPDYDYIITAEAKGIPLAHEMARLQNNEKYFVARKKPKLYMTGVFKSTVNSITTEGEQKLYLDKADAELMKGKKILIVDDVVSLGQSLAAVEKLVNDAGGIVCGKMFVLAEGDASNRDDIIFLEKLPLFDKDGKEI